MTGDPIIDEIRRYRDEYAARFDYDVRAIGEDMRKRYAERLATANAERPTDGCPSDPLLPAEDYAGSAIRP